MLVAQILLALLAAVAAFAFRREARCEKPAGAPAGAGLRIRRSRRARQLRGSPLLRLARRDRRHPAPGLACRLFACVCVEWSLDERHAPVHAFARERRSMAADVHDLIMQDLSFAFANARTLVDDPARGDSGEHGHQPPANARSPARAMWSADSPNQRLLADRRRSSRLARERPRGTRRSRSTRGRARRLPAPDPPTLRRTRAHRPRGRDQRR